MSAAHSNPCACCGELRPLLRSYPIDGNSTALCEDDFDAAVRGELRSERVRGADGRWQMQITRARRAGGK